MQDDGHRNSSLQRRGRARISRPEGGGDCYVSAKWGQLAVHRCMIELSGDSSSARMEPGDRRTAGFRPGSCPLWVNHDHCGPSHMIAHVRFAPKADKTAGASARLLSANRVLTRCSKHHRYSITSSARASMMGGISRPIAFAVLTLITSVNLVGRSIGKSAALAPVTQ